MSPYFSTSGGFASRSFTISLYCAAIDLLIGKVCLERFTVQDQDLVMLNARIEELHEIREICFGDHRIKRTLDFPYIIGIIIYSLNKCNIILLRDHELLVFYDVVLHAFEQANERLTLNRCKLTAQYCHKHINTLLCERSWQLTSTAPT